jgi:hypothetical protein
MVGDNSKQFEIFDCPGGCRDPNDDMYLETCQVSRAHDLVTGDPDLLEVDVDDLKKHRLGRLTISPRRGRHDPSFSFSARNATTFAGRCGPWQCAATR